MPHPTHPGLVRYGALLVALLILGTACTTGGSSASPTPATPPTATATRTPSATATPQPTATPTVTPSPTPYVAPTVAVVADDNVRACLERNLTPRTVDQPLAR